MASTLDLFTAIAAGVGATGGIIQAGTKVIEVWRSRSAITVTWGHASGPFNPQSPGSIRVDRYFSITATLKGRHPVRVDSAGIAFDGRIPWWRWRKRQLMSSSVPIIHSLGLIPSMMPAAFPVLLEPSKPSVSAYEETDLVRPALRDTTHGQPYAVWVSTPAGRIEKRLKKWEIALMKGEPLKKGKVKN